ncbi:MAG: hypothetical protein Q7U04_06800 [Bacteriovorax sp.]|nr:hypothetical protein [Bacteriovorax sp.]
MSDLSGLKFIQNLSKLKLVLLLCFSILLLFQFLVGFRELEDYLVVFIFILFLNDLYFKIKQPQSIHFQEERLKRLLMTLVFLGLFLLPFIFDSIDVSNSARLTLYKLGFVLWAQVFLVDSFLHYKHTQSKQWLVFANFAMLMIIVGAFVG